MDEAIIVFAGVRQRSDGEQLIDFASSALTKEACMKVIEGTNKEHPDVEESFPFQRICKLAIFEIPMEDEEPKEEDEPDHT